MSSITKQLNKVAEITLLFWLMKIVATTLGETFGDFLSMTLNLGYLTALCITLGLFAVLVLLQISTRKYIPVLYWLVIIATTTLGTEKSVLTGWDNKPGKAKRIVFISYIQVNMSLSYNFFWNTEGQNHKLKKWNCRQSNTAFTN